MSVEDPCRKYRDDLANYFKEMREIQSNLYRVIWVSEGEDSNKHAVDLNEKRSEMSNRLRELAQLISDTLVKLTECEVMATKK